MYDSDDRPTPPNGHQDGEPVETPVSGWTDDSTVIREPPARRRPRGEAGFYAALGRWLRKAGRLKSMVILALGLLGGGAVAGAWSSDLVRRGELAAEHAQRRAELAAEHDLSEAGRTALAVQVQELQVKVGRLDASLSYIERVVYQVAVAQGVRNVPPPPSTAAFEPHP